MDRSDNKLVSDGGLVKNGEPTTTKTISSSSSSSSSSLGGAGNSNKNSLVVHKLTPVSIAASTSSYSSSGASVVIDTGEQKGGEHSKLQPSFLSSTVAMGAAVIPLSPSVEESVEVRTERTDSSGQQHPFGSSTLSTSSAASPALPVVQRPTNRTSSISISAATASPTLPISSSAMTIAEKTWEMMKTMEEEKGEESAVPPAVTAGGGLSPKRPAPRQVAEGTAKKKKKNTTGVAVVSSTSTPPPSRPHSGEIVGAATAVMTCSSGATTFHSSGTGGDAFADHQEDDEDTEPVEKALQKARQSASLRAEDSIERDAIENSTVTDMVVNRSQDSPPPPVTLLDSSRATEALVALCQTSKWNPDPKHMLPLIVSGRANVFQLVEEGEVIAGTLYWPLFHLLLFKGRVEAVKACLSTPLPMDFTIRDEHYGRTPLHRACEACLSHDVSRQMLVAIARRLQKHPEDTIDWHQCDDFELNVVQSAANHQKLCLLWHLLGTEFAGMYDEDYGKEEEAQVRRRWRRCGSGSSGGSHTGNEMAALQVSNPERLEQRRSSSLGSTAPSPSSLVPPPAVMRERGGGLGAPPLHPRTTTTSTTGGFAGGAHRMDGLVPHKPLSRRGSGGGSSLTGFTRRTSMRGGEGWASSSSLSSGSSSVDAGRYDYLNLQGPVLLPSVWRWEWESLTAAGATRRFFKVKKHQIIDADEATGELWRLATHHPENASTAAVEELVAAGADVAFLKDNMTILHRFIRAGAVNAVRACLQTQRSIDFTVKNDFLWTLFHSGVSLVTRAHRRDVSHVMMCAILDRLESHPADGVDWSGKNCAGDNLLSTAAAYGKLSLLWNLLISRRIPYFHNYPGPIPITTRVYKEDWDQLSEEHQARFELREGFETEELITNDNDSDKDDDNNDDNNNGDH